MLYEGYLYVEIFSKGWAAICVNSPNQLIQPQFDVPSRAKNNHNVDVAAAQLKVVASRTKNLDSQHLEVLHVLLDPTDARLDVWMSHLFPKLADAIVGHTG